MRAVTRRRTHMYVHGSRYVRISSIPFSILSIRNLAALITGSDAVKIYIYFRRSILLARLMRHQVARLTPNQLTI